MYLNVVVIQLVLAVDGNQFVHSIEMRQGRLRVVFVSICTVSGLGTCKLIALVLSQDSVRQSKYFGTNVKLFKIHDTLVVCLCIGRVSCLWSTVVALCDLVDLAH